MTVSTQESLLSLATDVATYLGEEWSTRRLYRRKNLCQLDRLDGASVLLTIHGGKDLGVLHRLDGATVRLTIYGGRVFASGDIQSDYPKSYWRPPEISIALARGPKTIAKEIERRLLPHYVSEYPTDWKAPEIQSGLARGRTTIASPKEPSEAPKGEEN